MTERDKDIECFAAKISAYCSKKGVSALMRFIELHAKIPLIRKKGVHIPHIALSKILFRSQAKLAQSRLAPPVPREIRLKQLQKITLDRLIAEDLRKKPENEFFKAAFEAYQANQRQDLHLFNLKRIYEENHLPKRNIMGWKLPKPVVTSSRIQFNANRHSALKNSTSNKRHAKILLKKRDPKEDEEKKRLADQMSLQKELTDKHYYSSSRPIMQ